MWQEPFHFDSLADLHESPSLSTRQGAPAYELKFLLSEAQASEVETRIHGQLSLDAHADPRLGSAYGITTLYCDTPVFDVFHRIGACKRRKFRLRRYGDAASVFLERKSKWGERVSKRRVPIACGEVPALAKTLSSSEWPGHWFHEQILRRALSPVCLIAQERIAYVGQAEGSPLRLTFDRQVRGTLTKGWMFEGFERGVPLFPDRVICELKYRSFLPALFKGLVHSMRLKPSPMSKYRAFVRTTSLARSTGDV